MADAESPIRAAARTASQDVAEAFALLADETRLAILLALWEEYDPYSGVPVSFSHLFDMVAYDDRGNFNYHLQNLEGQFVSKDPEVGGYELRDPGLTLVQVVIAGIDDGDARFDATEIEQPCQLCGAPTAVGYRERHVFWQCTDCSGIVPEGSELDGFLGAVQLEPAGVVDRTPEEVKAASQVAVRRREGSMFDGLCPTCSGPVDGWLDPCPDHDPDGVCENCNRRFSTRAFFECRICKDHASTSPLELALVHPAVITFFEIRGVSMRLTADDVESVKRMESIRGTLVEQDVMTVVSTDPPRVSVTLSFDGDEIRLVFDETVRVVDVESPDRPA